MRQVLHGDVTAAARLLRAAPAAERAAAFARLVAEAELADRWRRRTGRAHPDYGDGTLMAAALAHRPGPEPFLTDAEYLDCLRVVIEGLIARHAGARPGEA
jgi:hypothetical protein